MCETCHKYYCYVSLVIQCVTKGLKVTNLNKVRWGVVGSKSAFKAFGRLL
jgi:hypothetical protein